LRVFSAGFAGNDGGGGDAEEKREGDEEKKAVEKDLRSGVGGPGEQSPEQDGGDGAPGAGPGLPKPAPKKVAMVQAQYFVPFWFWTGTGEVALLVMGVAEFALAAAEGAEVFKDVGVEDGELIL